MHEPMQLECGGVNNPEPSCKAFIICEGISFFQSFPTYSYTYFSKYHNNPALQHKKVPL